MPEVRDLLSSAAGAPVAALDLDDVLARGARRATRRRAAAGVLAAVSVAAALTVAGLVSGDPERDAVLPADRSGTQWAGPLLEDLQLLQSLERRPATQESFNLLGDRIAVGSVGTEVWGRPGVPLEGRVTFSARMAGQSACLAATALTGVLSWDPPAMGECRDRGGSVLDVDFEAASYDQRFPDNPFVPDR